MLMPLTFMVLPVPTFLFAKVGGRVAVVKTSPATRSSESVTVAAVVPSYTLFTPDAVTVRDRAVMFAVAVAIVELSVYLLASVPVSAKPEIVTVLPFPTFLLANVADVHVTETLSEPTLGVNPVNETEAVIVPS